MVEATPLKSTHPHTLGVYYPLLLMFSPSVVSDSL